MYVAKHFISSRGKEISLVVKVGTLILCMLFAFEGLAQDKSKKKGPSKKAASEAKNSSNDKAELSKLLTRVDNLWIGEASEAKMTMKVKKKEYNRELGLKYWVKGRDKTLVLITDPTKERGTATLKINGEMHNYLPNTGATLRLARPYVAEAGWAHILTTTISFVLLALIAIMKAGS